MQKYAAKILEGTLVDGFGCKDIEPCLLGHDKQIEMNDIILRHNARQIQQMEENLLKSAKSLDELKKQNE